MYVREWMVVSFARDGGGHKWLVALLLCIIHAAPWSTPYPSTHPPIPTMTGGS